MKSVEQKICRRNLIAAYVDGELSEAATTIFEQHVEDCAECRTELRAHRLFVCELDAALTGKVELPVPDDFSKVIAVRARSDMHGVRTRSENKKAIAICAVLALAGFALLGTTAREAVFGLTGTFVNSVIGIAGFLSSLVYDAVAGLVVILRVLGQKVVVGNGSLSVLLVFLAVAVFVLSRLIADYHHRTGATE
jgi:anti-sigma factor RsiW